MAEKKFFVDINLQGSALTNAKIGTNSEIGSTEGAFGYDSGSHRLQYFNGTATQNVANLSDISAVTGGLIFQGGYDPTTNTPDIADGTALKGYFWAATAAGTFLGESVQVGDSIVAKVDNAGATIADWLILQGNIVIATDSVDGISRLATQTEANDGTEGGAVVITPATLQGKIDAQITPEINSKVSKSGDTMSGNLNMGNNNITGVNGFEAQSTTTPVLATSYLNSGPDTSEIFLNNNLDAQNSQTIVNLPAPTNNGDATNKLYVDNASNDKLPLAGGTMSGNIDLGGFDINGAHVVNANLFGSSTNSVIAFNNNLDFNNDTYLINIPAPTNGGDAANKTYVDDAAADAQANAEANAAEDATAKANAAETDAKQYADSLAPNYDAAGAAAQALTDANTYTDTGLATKLDLAGGAMSGAIDMGNNSISNINDVDANSVATNRVITDELTSVQSGILVSKNLSLDGNSIQNLGAPVEHNDAVRKGYVDARSTMVTVATIDWVLLDGVYSVQVNHGISGNVMITILYDNKPAEFDFEKTGPSDTTLYSNILPTGTTKVNVVKL